MTIHTFVNHLRQLNVRVWEQGGRLHYSAPRGVMNATLRADLAQRKSELLALLRTADASAAAPIPRLPRQAGRPLPASFAQERLWFLAQLEPDNPAYNMPAAITLRGTLAVGALQRGVDELVRRHETLRTRFGVNGGAPVQIIDPPAAQALPVVDLAALAPARRQAEVERLAAEDAAWLFDLARGPLLRTTLVALDPGTSERSEHVLLVNQHHVISDGWSIVVLIRELAALYAAFTRDGADCLQPGASQGGGIAVEEGRGRATPLPELAVQYADFAVWQRRWLEGERLERQLAWWRPRLSPPLPVLDLPRDRPRPAVRSHRGTHHRRRLAPELAAALRRLAWSYDATLFMTLLAAFQLLLHRLSGEEDVLVGFPIAGRSWAEVEDLIGIFLNSLVVRTDLSGRPSFRELLARVRTEALGAFAHQDVPFEKLLEVFQPERDLSGTPVFQVFFNMLNLPAAELRLPGLTLELRSEVETRSKFDLTVYVTEERGGTIAFDLVSNADLFDGARMEEMLAQYAALLEQIAADPEAEIGSYSLLTPAARRLLPQPEAPLSDRFEGPIHAGLTRQAQRFPQRPAVIDPEGSWSYRELDRRGNQLARWLRAHGVGREQVVAVWAHRSRGLVWALVGILKAGGAFLILDPAHPAARLRACVRLARPRAWLEVAGAPPPPPELVAGPRLRLSAEVLAGEPATDPGVAIAADDLAYVAFTSGSTGEPRGILGRHGPLTHFLPWLAGKFAFDHHDRHSLLSALAHDPLHRDVFMPLWYGATICIPDPERIVTPGYLADWVRDQRLTVLNLAPAMMQILCQGQGPLDSLRYAFVIGDVLRRDDVAALYQLSPTVVCVNYYGSTETQRSVSYYVAEREAAGRAVVPLGRGIEDVQLLVLNRAGRLTGIGELGEIHFRSHHLARGYLDDDELTRQRFLPSPFSDDPGDRLYRTGDLGRYLPDGNVEFAGRADHQVKIRGFRIEPGEIEAILGAHPEVTQGVVTAREDGSGNRYLAAYVVSPAVPPPTARELRRFLKERLPDYMVPSVFVDLDALPLTANHKVDRSRLPAPPADAVARPPYAPPATPVEETLAEIFQQITGRGRVGSGDDFFELGGHSLVATQVVSRIRDTFGILLPVRVLFETPVVHQLALVVDEELMTLVEGLTGED